MEGSMTKMDTDSDKETPPNETKKNARTKKGWRP